LKLPLIKPHFVLDCHLEAGDYDHFLKVRVQDIADFNKLHVDQLIAFPGVRQIRSFLRLKKSQITQRWPGAQIYMHQFKNRRHKKAALGVCAAEFCVARMHSEGVFRIM